VSKGRLFALHLVRVRGRSMLPTLADGDLLLVRSARRLQRRARQGRLAIVRLSPDRPVSVKRLGIRDAGGWWVERDNPAEGVDSWQLGRPVPDTDIIGLVVLRVWPPPFRLPAAPAGPSAASRSRHG
jgi:phage repressor protein C with HTH and peptisase S24 domain